MLRCCKQCPSNRCPSIKLQGHCRRLFLGIVVAISPPCPSPLHHHAHHKLDRTGILSMAPCPSWWREDGRLPPDYSLREDAGLNSALPNASRSSSPARKLMFTCLMRVAVTACSVSTPLLLTVR